MAGKGDKRRPAAVSAEQFAANWDAVFGKPRETPMQRLEAIMNNGTGRVLVESYSDATADWVIPPLDDILGRAEMADQVESVPESDPDHALARERLAERDRS